MSCNAGSVIAGSLIWLRCEKGAELEIHHLHHTGEHRFLLQDEALRDISNDAKELYALLLDRASVSRQNGYIEPDDTIRLYFTLEQAQTKLLAHVVSTVDFNPRPPRGGRQLGFAGYNATRTLQSTPPARGATTADT